LPFLFLPRERENSTLFSFFRLILVGWWVQEGLVTLDGVMKNLVRFPLRLP
jgi:hypothetical protein